MLQTLSERIELAIKILEYCIKENKSIKQGCPMFGKHEGYLRRLRSEGKPTTSNEKKLFKAFNDKYNLYLKERLNSVHKEVFDEFNDGDLLSSDTIIEEESTKQTETADGKLEVDFRGNEIIKTSDQLIKAAKIDLDLWRLDREVANKWDVTMKGPTGDPITAQNFQVKLWLTKKQDAVQTFNAVETFKQLLAEIPSPQHTKINYDFANHRENNLLEINIFDLHIGKLCWAGETGENYDVKIASRRFMDALTKLLHRAKGFQFEKILFPIGNDFFNVDTILNTTTEGTPQDEDLRWQKTFKIGFELLISGIELMRQYAPVDIVMIPGNHDYMKNYFLGHSLESWYRNNEDITVNNHASPRKYYRYGEVLLGLTHGNNEKEAALPQIMAVENRKMWASTSFHEWHLGHFHKKKTIRYQVLDENLGVTVRYLSSLTGKDSWHHKKGYVGSNKSAEAFLWNANTGFIGQFNVNIVDDDCDPLY